MLSQLSWRGDRDGIFESVRVSASTSQMSVALVGLIAGIVGLIYWLLQKNNDHWTRKGVAQKAPQLFFGSIKERMLATKSMHDFYRELYHEFDGAPYVGIFEGRRPNLMVRDPELIRLILSKDFDHFTDRPFSVFKGSPFVTKILFALRGAEWKSVRAILTPTFTSGKIKAMMHIVEDCSKKMMNYVNGQIDAAPSHWIDIDIKEIMSKFSLDVIAATAFGVDCDSFSDPESKFIRKISAFGSLSVIKRFILLTIVFLSPPEWLSKHIPLTFFNMESVNFLVEVVKETTKYRKENNVRKNDFLQLLIDAQEESLKEENNGKYSVFTEEMSIAQSVVFFIAGFDTSSSLLSMACYSLAIEPDVQAKLRAEVDEKMSETDGNLTYDDLFSMSYLDMVISETLRLYPPLARLDRTCTKSYKLGNIDFKVGDRLYIPCHGLHTDPKYFPDPFKFDPERFTAEAKAARHPYVYMPFGLGPRICIGLRFALMSTKLCLARIISNYTIEVIESTPIPFQYEEKSILIKAKVPVKLRLKSVRS